MRSSLRRRATLGTAFAALGVGLTTLSAHPAAAQTTVYDNTGTYLGAFKNGVATGTTGATLMVADDITPAAGFAGKSVTSFSFSIANFNTADVAVSPLISFYSQDATTGGPATLLTAPLTFSSITEAAGNVDVYTATSASGFFALPSSTFWAGISFSSTTATAAQLANIGQGVFAPPTVGSSSSNFFQSTSNAPTTSSPAGSFLHFTSASAPSFGWTFQTAAAPVPEASTTVSLGLMLALGMGGLVVASKRKKASVQA